MMRWSSCGDIDRQNSRLISNTNITRWNEQVEMNLAFFSIKITITTDKNTAGGIMEKLIGRHKTAVYMQKKDGLYCNRQVVLISGS